MAFIRARFLGGLAILSTALVVAVGCSSSSGTPGGAGGSGAGGTPGGTGGFGNGKSTLSGLPYPPGNGGLPQPTGTPGNFKVINWAGYKAAVSYTFDDTNSSQIAHYADLNGLGVPLTFYLITGKTEFNDPIWAQALLDGHEIGNHTMTHQQVGTAADVDAGFTAIMTKFGITPWTMAAPYGDASYVPIASTRYLLNRGVSNGLIAPNSGMDPFNLACFIPAQGALAADFNVQIDQAEASGAWRTVLVHGFTGGTDGAYQPVDIAEFVSGVNHTKALGDVWIDTMTAVGAYWRGGKTLMAVTPVTAGDTTTWTWTLPDHFPPGKYLRVTVDGGTLSQGGSPLPWNDHGFYEVALDPGTVTLGP